MNDKFSKLNYSVLEDKSLSDKDKIVLSIISSLTNNKGYAYATNKYISDIDAENFINKLENILQIL